MNILTMKGGLAQMTDEDVATHHRLIVECAMCSDAAAKVYHEISNPELHASGAYLVGLMPSLRKIEVH